MQVDEELEGSIEEIGEELPENAPRYIVLSHALVSFSNVQGPLRLAIHIVWF
jgi:hypothetical protein